MKLDRRGRNDTGEAFKCFGQMSDGKICGRTASVIRDDEPYCGRHDPFRVGGPMNPREDHETITLEPNYGALYDRSLRAIAPSVHGLIRDIERTTAAEARSDLLGRLNEFAFHVNMSLQCSLSVEQIQQVRFQTGEALTKINEAFNRAGE